MAWRFHLMYRNDIIDIMFGSITKKVSLNELQEVLKTNPLIVDVRTNEEFQNESIKGSINIPVDKIGVNLDKLKGKQQIVVYCQSGVRSSYAKSVLENLGFMNVFDAGSILNFSKI